MLPVLRLFEDILSGAAPQLRLAALPRMIFVVHGTVTIDGRPVGADDAWHGEGAATLVPGKDGDLALYDGDPFEYTSHCTGVVIQGEVVSEAAN